MGLAFCGFIVLCLMELMSRGSRLGSSPVKLCCDGYTLQHLGRKVNKNDLHLRDQALVLGQIFEETEIFNTMKC